MDGEMELVGTCSTCGKPIDKYEEEFYQGKCAKCYHQKRQDGIE